MKRNRFCTVATACVVALVAASATSAAGTPEDCNPRLFLANMIANQTAGPGIPSELATMCAGSPWATSESIAVLPSSPGEQKNYTVRVFGDIAYVVAINAGLIQTFETATGVLIDTFDFGAGSQPHDIVVTASDTAYVSVHGGTHLHRLDLRTGTTTPVADLTVFAPEKAVPAMSMIAHDVVTNRLFIQVQAANGIAIFDLANETLVDVDPNEPGAQPVLLQGLLPQHKMQIDQAQRRLYVNATGGFWGFTGGIEMIDLDALTSIGFAFDTKDFGVPEISGFVMVSATSGYLIFHTDIAPSSHLLPFTIGQKDGLSSIVDFLGYPTTTSLAFDPRTGHVYMPHGGFFGPTLPDAPAVYVFDAKTGDLLSNPPVTFGSWPQDLALDQRCSSDLNLDGTVNAFDLLDLLGRWGSAESFEPADLDDNGAVNVFDLLRLLADWGPCGTG